VQRTLAVGQWRRDDAFMNKEKGQASREVESASAPASTERSSNAPATEENRIGKGAVGVGPSRTKHSILLLRMEEHSAVKSVRCFPTRPARGRCTGNAPHAYAGAFRPVAAERGNKMGLVQRNITLSDLTSRRGYHVLPPRSLPSPSLVLYIAV
jgi:hypothetical protein